VTILSISSIYKDAWIINFGTSQHLTFQKEVFSTFEEFTLNHKIYLGTKVRLMYVGKALLSLIYQMRFSSVLEMYVGKALLSSIYQMRFSSVLEMYVGKALLSLIYQMRFSSVLEMYCMSQS